MGVVSCLVVRRGCVSFVSLTTACVRAEAAGLDFGYRISEREAKYLSEKQTDEVMKASFRVFGTSKSRFRAESTPSCD